MSIQKYEEFIKESNEIQGGKALLITFMKCLTALGQKNNAPALEFTPQNFLLFYDFKNLDSKIVRGVFGRFKSLSHFAHLINYENNTLSLYFGIKCDGSFEYGLRYDKELKPIGNFKLNQSGINSLTRLQSLSAGSIKKELVNLTAKDILLMGQIKIEMQKFNPGYHDKVIVPIIKDKIMTFAYHGLGKWEGGKIDEEDLNSTKSNFKDFISKYKWCEKILISIKPGNGENSFWVYFYIKIK